VIICRLSNFQVHQRGLLWLRGRCYLFAFLLCGFCRTVIHLNSKLHSWPCLCLFDKHVKKFFADCLLLLCIVSLCFRLFTSHVLAIEQHHRQPSDAAADHTRAWSVGSCWQCEALFVICHTWTLGSCKASLFRQDVQWPWLVRSGLLVTSDIVADQILVPGLWDYLRGAGNLPPKLNFILMLLVTTFTSFAVTDKNDFS